MTNISLILFGKFISQTTKALNLGNGSTWPGHIALKINKNFIQDILKRSQTKIIIVAGTNGKTTTSKLIAHLLEKSGKKVFLNESGANLLNGVASSILLHASSNGRIKYDYAIFESDENALPLILKEIKPDYLVILNLFRDQLDRYGEVNTIATKWKETIKKLDSNTEFLLNADDPAVAYLGQDLKKNATYFSSSDVSIKENNQIHAVDSIYCPKCGNKLRFNKIVFSHLGDWECDKCKLKKPETEKIDIKKYPLEGIYNQYNIQASALLAKKIGIHEDQISEYLESFLPAFGRQETLEIHGKNIKIFLSKNPTGFNESLRTAKQMGAKNILFILNDRIPDGKDVSWIWDTDLENILDGKEQITVSGDRVYDMALRIKYALKMENGKWEMEKFQYYEKLEQAIHESLDALPIEEILYIIPTYTAMLETRKILTGKKIL